MDPHAAEKRAAAEAAAREVRDGMTLGLGTGSTTALFVRALGGRRPAVVCVATSPATAELARSLGLDVRAFDAADSPARLDLAVDGADQVDAAGWLVKGGGGAHLREKVVAASADRFVGIVSSNKLVGSVGPPIPLELAAFGLRSTLRRLGGLGPVALRDAPPTPDGGVLADLLGSVGDPAALAAALDGTPGVAGHGLFPPEMVWEVLVGTADGGIRRIGQASG